MPIFRVKNSGWPTFPWRLVNEYVREHVDIEVDGDLLAFAHEVVVVGEGDVGVVFEVRRG